MTTVSRSGAVGLIGLGEIGQVHAAAIRRVPAARLAAVADTAAERLRPFAAEGVRAYPDAAALIADPQVGTVSVGPPGTFDDEIEITGTDATLRLGAYRVPVRRLPDRGPALAMFRERRWSQVPVRDDRLAGIRDQASVTAYLDAVIAGRRAAGDRRPPRWRRCGC